MARPLVADAARTTGALRPAVNTGPLWSCDRIEYAQWLWYCGLEPWRIAKHLRCSRGVLMRNLRADLAAVRAVRSEAVIQSHASKISASRIVARLPVNMDGADAE